jgi:hypothetical protein
MTITTLRSQAKTALKKYAPPRKIVVVTAPYGHADEIMDQAVNDNPGCKVIMVLKFAGEINE